MRWALYGNACGDRSLIPICTPPFTTSPTPSPTPPPSHPQRGRWPHCLAIIRAAVAPATHGAPLVLDAHAGGTGGILAQGDAGEGEGGVWVHVWVWVCFVGRCVCVTVCVYTVPLVTMQ